MPSWTIPTFVQKRFPKEISFGFSGGPVFFTQVSSTSGGHEQRQQNWEQARRRYNASHEIKDREEMEELLNFFLAVRGMAVGFRFVDWNDWSSDVDANQGIVWPALAAIGDMTHQDMVNATSGAIGVGDGAETHFQATKKYELEPVVGDFVGVNSIVWVNATSTITRTVGSWITDGFEVGDTVYATGTYGKLNDGSIGTVVSRDATDMVVTGTLVDEAVARFGVRLFSQADDVAPYYREITKLVTIRVIVDGVTWTEADAGADTYTVDYDSGIITANTAPAAGETVKADFIFDTPVRFEKDDWLQELEHFGIGSVPDISLIELRV